MAPAVLSRSQEISIARIVFGMHCITWHMSHITYHVCISIKEANPAAYYVSRGCRKAGNRKATVLPLPVVAMPMMSWLWCNKTSVNHSCLMPRPMPPQQVENSKSLLALHCQGPGIHLDGTGLGKARASNLSTVYRLPLAAMAQESRTNCLGRLPRSANAIWTEVTYGHFTFAIVWSDKLTIVFTFTSKMRWSFSQNPEASCEWFCNASKNVRPETSF